jgi:hypothetical protein
VVFDKKKWNASIVSILEFQYCPSGEIRLIVVSLGPYPATDMPLAYRI